MQLISSPRQAPNPETSCSSALEAREKPEPSARGAPEALPRSAPQQTFHMPPGKVLSSLVQWEGQNPLCVQSFWTPPGLALLLLWVLFYFSPPPLPSYPLHSAYRDHLQSAMLISNSLHSTVKTKSEKGDQASSYARMHFISNFINTGIFLIVSDLF